MEEIEEGVTPPALVILQQTAEQDGTPGDVQLEGNRVGMDMVNMLARGMDGTHLTMKGMQGVQASQITADLSMQTGIPIGAFYLTRQAKVLQAGEELWLEKDERLIMRGRLRGGMDGDWQCQHCGRQGCWVTKVRCCRCGKSI